MAESVKHVLLLLATVLSIFLIASFERRWRHGAYYCTTLMKLNEGDTIRAFSILTAAALISFLGTFLIAFDARLATVITFDVAVLLWAAFFAQLDAVIRKGGARI